MWESLKSKQSASYKEVLTVYAQEEVFYLLLGYYPSYIENYYSPFRKDKDAGCRFKQTPDGWIKFIDNAGYNNKISFNCFELGSLLKGVSVERFCYDLLIDKQVVFKTTFTAKKHIEYKCVIKIETEPWQKGDYFSQFDVPIELLNKAHIYKVKNYWADSSSSPMLVKNRYGKKDVMIAYYFPDSGNIKLYFPNELSLKWYSNTNVEDVFNWHIKDDIESDICVLTKSGKDAILIQSLFNVPTIALLNEQCNMPQKVIDYLNTKKRVIIYYDNDPAGILGSINIQKQLINGEIINNTGGSPKDASEYFITDRQGFTNWFRKCIFE
jgi:ferredoxin-fold anticodon binding domain-containing protein